MPCDDCSPEFTCWNGAVPCRKTFKTAPRPKVSGGVAIARNLHGCQIISGRDVERVAKQIDAGALKVAQLAMSEWLLELDAELANAALGFEEGVGAGRSGDAEAAAGAFLRSKEAIASARHRIEVALRIGFNA